MTRSAWRALRLQVLTAHRYTCARLDCQARGPLDVVAIDGRWTVLCRSHRLMWDAPQRMARAVATRQARRAQMRIGRTA